MSRPRTAIATVLALITAIPVASAIAHASVAVTGRIDERVVFDTTYHRERRVWVYTPPGYDPRAARTYPLIVAFDGSEYRDTLMPLPRILDSLLAAGKTPAFVALLVDNGAAVERIADPGNAERYAHFLDAQLIRWLRQGWHVTNDPHRVIVTGSSAGGLGAAFVALRRPDLFGNV